MTQTTHLSKTLPVAPVAGVRVPGYDPEMLFVECTRCGSPIVWEHGKTTRILEGAGIDALELDPHCLLVSSGCARCSRGGEYQIQIVRVQSEQNRLVAGRAMGHA